jgi:YggT family protein
MDFQPTNNFNNQGDMFSHRERYAHKHDVIERVIWIAGSALINLLAFRFLFALLAANPTNGFASFINNFTTPFVAPFYNLFNYDHPSFGASSFEGYTLIAMAIYGLIVAGLARLVSITRY